MISRQKEQSCFKRHFSANMDYRVTRFHHWKENKIIGWFILYYHWSFCWPLQAEVKPFLQCNQWTFTAALNRGSLSCSELAKLSSRPCLTAKFDCVDSWKRCYSLSSKQTKREREYEHFPLTPGLSQSAQSAIKSTRTSELLSTSAALQPETAGIDQRTLDVDHNTGLPKQGYLAWSSILSIVQMALWRAFITLCSTATTALNSIFVLFCYQALESRKHMFLLCSSYIQFSYHPVTLLFPMQCAKHTINRWLLWDQREIAPEFSSPKG